MDAGQSAVRLAPPCGERSANAVRRVRGAAYAAALTHVPRLEAGVRDLSHFEGEVYVHSQRSPDCPEYGCDHRRRTAACMSAACVCFRSDAWRAGACSSGSRMMRLRRVFAHRKQREPQMHTDKQGCTQILVLAEPTEGHVQRDGRESAPSVCIPAYRCASVVTFLSHGDARCSGPLSQIRRGLR
jgi:hypothetical protein